MKKMNLVPIPVKLRTLVKPVYPRQLLETKLRFSPLVSILCPIVEIASRTILKIGTAKAKEGNVTISQETAFPDDIDTLWERASKNYDIMLVRNREYLRWRYVANPDNYSILIARSDSGEILGYMVTKLASSGDKKTGFLVDFLVTEDKPDVFRRLLVTAVGEYFKARVNLALVWAIKGSMYDRILLRCGFIPYIDVPLSCYNNEIGSKVVSGTHKWHFTMGDTDNI